MSVGQATGYEWEIAVDEQSRLCCSAQSPLVWPDKTTEPPPLTAEELKRLQADATWKIKANTTLPDRRGVIEWLLAEAEAWGIAQRLLTKRVLSPRARAFVDAARVPVDLHPQRMGKWRIERLICPPDRVYLHAGHEPPGFKTQTLMRRDPTAKYPNGEIVMEDSVSELRQHLPLWMNARGRVLITGLGLGLGCVVRGLLSSTAVTNIDVVEIDPDVLATIGPEFAADPRVTLHLGDALTYDFGPEARWDIAWHDVWLPGSGGDLQFLHAQLIARYYDRCPVQGAWKLPRSFRRVHDGQRRTGVIL